MLQTLLVAGLFITQGALQPEGDGPARFPDPPVPVGASAFRLSPAHDSVILSWLETSPEGVGLVWSRLTVEGWGPPRTVVEPRGDVFANWADIPAVIEGGDGALYAHWLQSSGEGAYAYDIAVLRSPDGGETWDSLGLLNDDGVKGEHGFVSYVPDPGGVRAFWLDGRETGAGHGNAHAGTMTLRTAIVGAAIEPSVLVDPAVCDCCNTAAALTPRGPLVVYRDRAADEIRDIAIAGVGSAPRAVHADGWRIPGCPVNGPAIAGSGGLVAVAWFTAAPRPRVLAAVSRDGGGTFGDPIVLDEGEGDRAPLGRADVVLDGESAIACWIGAGGDLLLRRVSLGGEAARPLRVATISGARASGFPQLERLGDRVILIWRDLDADRLRARALASAEIPR